MSRQRSGYEYGAGGYPPDDPRRHLKLSGLIQQRLAATAEKHQQRTRLVHAVIVAQAIFTAATTAGYIDERSATLHLAIGAASVVLYLAALAASALLRQMNTAAYLLVGGGLVAVAAQTISLAVEPNPTMTAQASLLFIALTFEASLLFAPEVTLLVGFISTVCTAFAILFTLSLVPTMDQATAYLLMVYPVGLQALAGIVAWVVAQSALESAGEVAREEETHFAEARLQAMTAQRMDLDDQVRTLQQAITRTLGGEPQVHANVGEGALTPLAESLNVLLQRLAELSQADVDLTRMGAASLAMNDTLSQMADTPTPTPSSLPIMTNTPLDSVQLRLAQTQANLAQRIARMQRLAADVLGVLSNSQQPLDSATEAVQEARSIAGLLISAADSMLTLTTRQLTALQRVRRQLADHLPAEVTGPIQESPAAQAGAEGLSGRDLAGLRDVIGPSGLTGTFDVLTADVEADADADAGGETLTNITPLTRPLPAVNRQAVEQPSPARSSHKSRAAGSAASQPSADELLAFWNALAELDGEMRAVDRTVSKLARDVSAQAKTLRSADGDIAYLRQALAAIRGSADTLQQLAGTGLAMPQPLEPSRGSASRPLVQPAQGGQPPIVQGPPIPPPETLAELGTATPMPLDPTGETPSPGSLRASDLLQFSGDFSALDHPPTDASGNGNGNGIHGDEERE